MTRASSRGSGLSYLVQPWSQVTSGLQTNLFASVLSAATYRLDDSSIKESTSLSLNVPIIPIPVYSTFEQLLKNS